MKKLAMIAALCMLSMPALAGEGLNFTASSKTLSYDADAKKLRLPVAESSDKASIEFFMQNNPAASFNDEDRNVSKTRVDPVIGVQFRMKLY